MQVQTGGSYVVWDFVLTLDYRQKHLKIWRLATFIHYLFYFLTINQFDFLWRSSSKCAVKSAFSDFT